MKSNYARMKIMDVANIIRNKDIFSTVFNVAETTNVFITFGKDTTITSAEEIEQHDYDTRVKKNSLLGGGLGFTIGSEKRNDQYKDADITQKGSTVGSVTGNVTIDAKKDVHVNASDIIAGKDISMTGENVEISCKDNVYHIDEKHEYKKSGLTVSVGGATIDAINSVVQPITRASEVKDKRLAGLYAVKAAQEASQIAKTYKNQQDVIDSLYDKAGKETDLWAKGKDWKEADKDKDNQLGGKNTFTLNVGIGSSHSQAESHSKTKEAAGSHISATGNVTIKATKDDIRIRGSQVSGENVILDAKRDIDISAAENSNNTQENTKSSGASIGASIGVGGLQGVSASYSKANGHVKENETTYEKSQVTASKDLNFTSGKDTTITGSEMTGEKVTGNVGGSLSIETKQDKKTYEEKNSSSGLSINYGVKNGKTSASGGTSKDTIQSNYESATDQAGIRAGSEGFDITVKNNTQLKGGVIDSNASKDKNTLTTGSLGWEDTENKADYKAGGMGVSYAPNDKSSELNQRGMTPNLTPTVKGKVNSTTKSAVAEGTINIADKEQQKQDVSSLNRDTKNSLNQLQEIFDKTKIEERQELVGMLEKYGNQAIHKYSESKGWKDGSAEKMLLHGAFGALMGDLAGGSAATGVLSGSVNEYVMGYLTKTKGEDWVLKHPDTVQWIGAGVGTVLGKLSDGNMTEAVDIALAATKWNKLAYERMTKADVKNFLHKTNGKQMSDKEIEGLLSDIVDTVNQLDPEAAQSKYWEYGNEETENAVKECLREHGISDENVTAFIDEYKKVYRKAAKEDLDLFKKKTGVDLNKYSTKLKGEKEIFELPKLLVTASRNHPLLEECEHSDMYEAQRDLERNLDADLIESRRDLGTRIAAESPEWANENYGGLKAIGFVGANVAEKIANTPIASKFLRYSLEGSGEALSFEQDSDVSKDLEHSEVLASKIRELSQSLKPGEKKYFYSSMDFNGGKMNPSRDQQLAYGKVKIMSV